jgi:hypothetical protein
MVRLGVGLLRGSSPDTPTLRQDALWYPSLPPKHISLNEKLYTGHSDNYTGFEPMFWISLGARSISPNYHKAIEMRTSRYDRVGPIKIIGEDEEGNPVAHVLGRGHNVDMTGRTLLELDGVAGESIDYLRATITPSSPEEHQYLLIEDCSIHHGVMTGLVV